jgi:hypothetical protein
VVLIESCLANDRLGARGGLSAPAIPDSGRRAAAGTRTLSMQDSIVWTYVTCATFAGHEVPLARTQTARTRSTADLVRGPN